MHVNMEQYVDEILVPAGSEFIKFYESIISSEWKARLVIEKMKVMIHL